MSSEYTSVHWVGMIHVTGGYDSCHGWVWFMLSEYSSVHWVGMIHVMGGYDSCHQSIAHTAGVHTHTHTRVKGTVYSVTNYTASALCYPDAHTSADHRPPWTTANECQLKTRHDSLVTKKWQYLLHTVLSVHHGWGEVRKVLSEGETAGMRTHHYDTTNSLSPWHHVILSTLTQMWQTSLLLVTYCNCHTTGT